jgi:phosphohistidine phosphatase
MQLILWRHAEAEDLAPSDLRRNLTVKGRIQAEQMARWLKQQIRQQTKDEFRDWRVIVSPAVRAQQTASALEMNFETLDSIAPDAAPDAVLSAANWPRSQFNAIVVGHQPTLGMVAARLLNGTDGYVSIKKGATWWFESRERNGTEQTVLKAMTLAESFR